MATASRAAIGTEQINPNNSEYPPVAAGLGNRSQIREELPLSTRVHELAKELGLKSQELLERIQKWGLDVKANALASLDPEMVDRIRELMDQPAAGKGSTTAVPSPKPAADSIVGGGVAHGCAPRSAREERPAPATRPVGPAQVAAGSAKIEPIKATEATTTASSTPAPATAPPQRLIPGSSPSASAKPPSSVGVAAAPPPRRARNVRPRRLRQGLVPLPWLVLVVFPGPGPRPDRYPPTRRIEARARDPVARRLAEQDRDTTPEASSLPRGRRRPQRARLVSSRSKETTTCHPPVLDR